MLGVAVKPTIKEVDEEGRVIKTLVRAGLWEVQTPQVSAQELMHNANSSPCDTGVKRMRAAIYKYQGEKERLCVTPGLTASMQQGPAAQTWAYTTCRPANTEQMISCVTMCCCWLRCWSEGDQ